MRHYSKHSGFTLIELSIVLVIIGLIVGGVLVGRDLIRGAETRGQVAQIEKIQSAVHTFREKYGSLPGDMAGAAQFGFTQAQGSADGWGATSTPGDGLVMSCRNDSTTTSTLPPYGFVSFGCENAMFWNHLSQAGLIEGGFTRTDDATTYILINSPELYTPTSKISGNYLLASAWNGVNYIYIIGLHTYLSNGGSNGSISAKNKLTPMQSYAIDIKTDDGMPVTGRIRAIDYADGVNMKINLANACLSGINAYNVSGSTGTTPLCQLQIAGGF